MGYIWQDFPKRISHGKMFRHHQKLYCVSYLGQHYIYLQVWGSIPGYWWSSNILKSVIGQYLCQNCPKKVNWDKIHCYYPIPRLWWSSSILKPSSSASLATPEVAGRPCCNSVESAYWSGDFLKRFFQFDPSLTSGMSAVLMWGHWLRRRPYIKQHMSAGRVAQRKKNI